MSGEKWGGAAFPEAYWQTPESDQPSYRGGMYLRDYFAAYLSVGMIGPPPGASDEQMLEWATSVFRRADALLEARKK